MLESVHSCFQINKKPGFIEQFKAVFKYVGEVALGRDDSINKCSKCRYIKNSSLENKIMSLPRMDMHESLG